MLRLTQTEADRVVDTVNGYPMTYADYLDNTNVEFEIVLSPAEQNIADIDRIRKAMCSGTISYAEAKEQAAPVIERINNRAKEIAKKHGRRPQLVSFAGVMR